MTASIRPGACSGAAAAVKLDCARAASGALPPSEARASSKLNILLVRLSPVEARNGEGELDANVRISAGGACRKALRATVAFEVNVARGPPNGRGVKNRLKLRNSCDVITDSLRTLSGRREFNCAAAIRATTGTTRGRMVEAGWMGMVDERSGGNASMRAARAAGRQESRRRWLKALLPLRPAR